MRRRVVLLLPVIGIGCSGPAPEPATASPPTRPAEPFRPAAQVPPAAETVFAPRNVVYTPPVPAGAPPRVTRIDLPAAQGLAVWGATGRDAAGHVWAGLHGW